MQCFVEVQFSITFLFIFHEVLRGNNQKLYVFLRLFYFDSVQVLGFLLLNAFWVFLVD